MQNEPKPQWAMTVTVWHGPTFGHSVEVQTVTKGRADDTQDTVGKWKGTGIPEQVYEGVLASVHAILAQHLACRYGVAPSLAGVWEVEPDPF